MDLAVEKGNKNWKVEHKGIIIKNKAVFKESERLNIDIAVLMKKEKERVVKKQKKLCLQCGVSVVIRAV